MKTIKFKQILAAPFTTVTGASYSMFGLGTDGAVYRFDPQCDGWIPWSTNVVGCKTQHKAKR
jgi:hypothetical protein